MDINDVKALIKSLVLTSTTAYNVPKLVQDFEAETGISFPIFNFSNPKAFLKSLTDTVKFVGSPPFEKLLPVTSEKTQHIASLIRRQGRMGFNHKGKHSHPDMFLSKNPFEEKTSAVTQKSKSYEELKTDRKKNIYVRNKLQNKVHNKTFKDIIFREDEIKTIHKHPGLDPGLRLMSPPKEEKCNDVEDSGSISSESCFVNEGVKNKLKELMKKQTQGIWCCDLPDLYEECYKFPLEFKEFGYRSLIGMVMELNDIFRYVRPGNGDWLLFDASKPPSPEESDIRSASQSKIPEYVEKNLSLLIESYCENESKRGIYLDDLLFLYFKKFHKRLNFTEFGFPNIKSLLTKLDGNFLHLEKEGYRFIIRPIVEHRVVNQERAVLPVTPDDDFFKELFPDDVVKQDENFPKLKIENHFRVGEKVDVNVADIWSPEKFHVQLKEYEKDFFNMNKSLQAFYNDNLNKYKMPDATIQPNQVCVAYFKDEECFDEWNRSVIVRRIKSSKVLVYFVDYGNRVQIDVKNLRFLHRDYFNLPAQSFAASLSFIKPPSGNVWSMESCKRFLKLVTVPTSEFYVFHIDHERDKIGGVIISVNGGTQINVGLALVKEKMAVCDVTQLQEFVPELRTRSVINKICSRYRKKSEHELEAEKKNLKKTVEENNVKSQGTDEIFKLNDIADAKTYPPEETEKIEMISEMRPVRMISPGQSLHLTNLNAKLDLRVLQVEKDIYALAFWILSTNELVKSVAETNLDHGLQMALYLARNVSNMNGLLSSI